MGTIDLQSEPSGQHMTAVTAVMFRGMHVVVTGQQKSDGNKAPHRVSVLSPPHTSNILERVVKPDSVDTLSLTFDCRMCILSVCQL